MFSQLWNKLTGAAPDPASTNASAQTEPVAEPEATAEPEQSPTTANHPCVATELTLRRSLDWRSKVLIDGASAQSKQGDGPALVDALRQADDSIIRQPPDAAARALRVANNPNSPLSEIVSLFEHDPMLAQALLRQANSVYYRRGDSSMNSLSAAVQRVGLQAVQSVLMGALVQSTLCRPGGAYDGLVTKVWTHMQRTAPIARGLSRAFKVEPEAAFSLALLHDVGKLVVFDHISSMRHRERRELRIPEMFFRNLLWHLHEPLGGLAALRWGMGGEAAHTIGEHHRRPAPEQPDPITECIYVAESIELCHSNFTRLDWEKIWSEGAITTDRAAVEARLHEIEH